MKRTKRIDTQWYSYEAAVPSSTDKEMISRVNLLPDVVKCCIMQFREMFDTNAAFLRALLKYQKIEHSLTSGSKTGKQAFAMYVAAKAGTVAEAMKIMVEISHMKKEECEKHASWTAFVAENPAEVSAEKVSEARHQEIEAAWDKEIDVLIADNFRE